jgi:hypothetical protein
VCFTDLRSRHLVLPCTLRAFFIAFSCFSARARTQLSNAVEAYKGTANGKRV